jgi:hypothetical protein
MADDLVNRLRGMYSMGPFGTRGFDGHVIPPIQLEAADEIERLRARVAELERRLR